MKHTIVDVEWPDGKRFAVCLTHDVDRIKKSYQYFTRSLRFLKKAEIKHASEEVFEFFKVYFSKNVKKDPYWNFEKIVEIEDKYNVRSTFFFLNETGKMNIFKPDAWKLYLGRYSIRDPEIVKVINELHLKGWEIGLHGSYNSYKNKNLLKKEKEDLECILGERVYGVRQHYLNLDIPMTWKIHEELGLRYDASYGFRSRIGFKNSPYLPFYPSNSPFLVIPLTIMDSALFSNNKNVKAAWRECKKCVELAEEKNAVLTVLWHQRSFNEEEFPKWGGMYEDLIALCKQKNAWIATASEIERWCNRCSRRW